MDSQSDKMTSLPPVSTSYTIKRSFVKVKSSSNSFSSSSDSVPTVLVHRRDSFDKNQKVVELRNRSESPQPVLRLKFSDNSSGYGSSASFSSIHHSIQKTPSMHCITNFSKQLSSTKKIEKPTKAHMIRESITNVLDQIDKRVAFLRETASELEDEKRKLYRALNSIITSDELGSVEEVEREEIKVASHGLLHRLNSIDIILKTTRNEAQEKALETVNTFIDKLSDSVNNDKELAKKVCQSYLSACSSDHFKPLPVDEKFQRKVIECTLDDQKKIKKKLQNIFTTI